MPDSLIASVRFDADGLVPAIAQDTHSGQVLMLAYMNAEALECTLREQRAVYFSRSRGKLWRKGQESGNIQKLIDIRLDCDGDTLLLRVEQVGGVACHTGRAHCFYRAIRNDGWYDAEPVIIDPKQLYTTSTPEE